MGNLCVTCANGGAVFADAYTGTGGTLKGYVGTYTKRVKPRGTAGYPGTGGTWGRPVVRGLYFIRIVGPGMNEIRKVIVAGKQVIISRIHPPD